jgi:imidazolonepropionase
MNDLVIKNIGQLITLKPGVVRKGKGAGELGILKNTSIGVKDGKITSIGNPEAAKKMIDAKGNVVMPGFVDCHTHLVFGGQRAHEFDARASGKTYVEIAEAGGGIASTVKSTREATESELFEMAIRNLYYALSWGTTSIEIKSGYGLSLSEEIKILKVTQSLKEQHPITIIPTFLGAHSVPPGGNRDDYIVELLDRQIPQASKLAKFCDVFCEKGVFSKEESRVILARCKEFGLGLKIHADEITSCGGSELAGELGAVSADHVVYPSDKGIQAMKEAGTIAVVLPGACLFLSHKPPTREFIDAQIPIAIGTDFNPGSSPVLRGSCYWVG